MRRQVRPGRGLGFGVVSASGRSDAVNWKMSEGDFAAKVDYEGGVISALRYGLSWTDLENPESELAQTWKRIEQVWDEQMDGLVEHAGRLLDQAVSDAFE